jgi:hypothetical protein
MLGQGAALPGGVRHVSAIERQSLPVSDDWWGMPGPLAAYDRPPRVAAVSLATAKGPPCCHEHGTTSGSTVPVGRHDL